MGKNSDTEPKIDSSKVITEKGLNIDKAVKYLEQEMRQADKGSGLFHKGRNDGNLDRGEVLESMEKNGVPLEVRLAAKKEFPPNLLVKIDDAVKFIKDEFHKLNKDKDTQYLSPKELAPIFNKNSKTQDNKLG